MLLLGIMLLLIAVYLLVSGCEIFMLKVKFSGGLIAVLIITAGILLGKLALSLIFPS